ncbi:MAG: LPS export ABC transporter periplasmic protein LptC [Treponema sp.]|jgi:LPS export ABC transporter protein LptC|nr:LPS export ABC transporter periplasmic protein LptC [Treponema sp.]
MDKLSDYKRPGGGRSSNLKGVLPLFFVLAGFVGSCSFDYGSTGGGDKSLPDIVMDNVEYVRIRSLDPQARLQAERVERYEERRIMELRNFSFEQFGNHGEDVNAYGRAGSALFEIDSGDIRMEDGVRLDVDSEEIAIETVRLEWKDKDRTLSGGESDEVHVYQENGTSFTGIGFQSNARLRTWSFSDTVSGTYVHDDDDDDADEEEAGGGEMAAKPAGNEQAGNGNDVGGI